MQKTKNQKTFIYTDGNDLGFGGSWRISSGEKYPECKDNKDNYDNCDDQFFPAFQYAKYVAEKSFGIGYDYFRVKDCFIISHRHQKTQSR